MPIWSRHLPRFLRRLLHKNEGKPPRGLYFADQFWSWEFICRHWLLLGGTGRGKTFTSETLLEGYMRAQCPMLLTTVKMDDMGRIEDIAKRAGQLHRLVEITPTNHRMDLIGRMLRPHNSAATAAERLTMIGEVGARGTPGGHDPFWDTHARRAIAAAITVCREVNGKAPPADVHGVILSTPASLAAHASPEWDESISEVDGKPVRRGRCAQVLLAGFARNLAKTSPSFKNAANYLLNEMPGGGDKMRGGITAGANNCLYPFLEPPYLDAFGSDTSMSAEIIERDNLIGVLNDPILTGYTPAQMWQFALTLDAQLHCLGRRYEKGTPPFIIGRDECGWSMANGPWESKMALVARSQGLSFLDIAQDVDSILMAMGRDNKDGVYAFVANHSQKLLFGGDSAETNRYASGIIGTHKSILISGGGPRKPAGRMLDTMLNVPDLSWSQVEEPIFKEHEFSRLPVGVGVLVSDGKHRVVDFRRK